MNPIHYYDVKIPGDQFIYWIGGALKPSKKRGRVWLTTVDGHAVLELPMSRVALSDRDHIIAKMMEDMRKHVTDSSKQQNKQK